MTAFNTKREALKFATKRKQGFRQLIIQDPTRKAFLEKAIRSVKIRRVKKKHWNKPLYIVEGM